MEMYTGSESGFSKLYTNTYSRPTLSSGLFAVTGKWTRARLGDFVKTASAPNSYELVRIDAVVATTVSTAGTTGDPTVTLTDAPVGDEVLIGIYDNTVGTWYYYEITNIAGSVVTLGNTSNPSSGLVRDVIIGDEVQVIRLEV